MGSWAGAAAPAAPKTPRPLPSNSSAPTQLKRAAVAARARAANAAAARPGRAAPAGLGWGGRLRWWRRWLPPRGLTAWQ